MTGSARTMGSIAVVAATIIALTAAPADAFAPSTSLISNLGRAASPIALSTRRLASPALRKAYTMTATQSPSSSSGIGWDSHKVEHPVPSAGSMLSQFAVSFPAALVAPLSLSRPRSTLPASASRCQRSTKGALRMLRCR